LKRTEIDRRVESCRKCTRIVSYLKEVDHIKVKRYREEAYWSKPVPGFGDEKASLIVIGLAPGAHGANRTGRMFTVSNVFIASTAHCAPPQNKLKASEIENCSSHLKSYMKLLSNKKVIVCLGGVAFRNFTKVFGHKGLAFGHLNEYELENYTLISSYHPSQYNTSTGRLKWEEWIKVFERARKLIL